MAKQDMKRRYPYNEYRLSVYVEKRDQENNF